MSPDQTTAERNNIESELRTAFGINSFLFTPEPVEVDGETKELPPVRIEVKSLSNNRLPGLSDSIMKLLVMRFVESREWAEIAALATRDVLRLLDPLVRVPSIPGATIGDLPIDVLPQCLIYVLRSISPGKWQALGQEAVRRFGLQMSDFVGTSSSQAQSA